MKSLTRSSSFLAAAVSVLTLSAPPPAPAETDYGQIAMYVANMLQRHHYSRKDFDDEVSARLLDHYIDFLDANRQYFIQEDIDQFNQAYRETLDDKILLNDITPAHEIYRVFTDRVKERMAKVREILKSEKFTFDSDRTVEISREESAWPASVEEADKLWHNLIESQLLAEKLRLSGAVSEEDPTIEEPEIEVAPDPDGGGTNGDANADKPEETPEELVLKRYERFVESLEENDEEDVVNFFLTALTSAYDPHSDWFSQSEMENFTISMKNSLVGIGALLSMQDGAAQIEGLVINGPAARAGELQVGDRVVGVGQGEQGEIEDVMFMKLQKIVEKIRGEQGSIVRLKVNPVDAVDPSVTKVISIVRDEVQLKDKLATAQLIESRNARGEATKIGWIELPSFYADMEERTTSATRDVERLLERLMNEGISGLVLDLRGNGGGSLEEAVRLTGLFIPRGPVVQSRDWRDKVDFRNSPRKYPFYEGPLVVLTDKASASASEILAAALQDYNRAVVIGESSTFGKGTVQTVLPVGQAMPLFSDKRRAGSLKATIQKFYRISGGSTQLKGVVPDITLPSVRDAMDIGEAALDNPLPWDEIAPQDYAKTSEAPLVSDEIRSRHLARIQNEPEYQYITQDLNRLKEQIERNTVSLNEAARLSEVEREKVRKEERKTAREERNKQIAETNPDRFRIYQLNLDNVDAEELTLKSDLTDADSLGMILSESRKERSQEPRFPYNMDPGKLETLSILQDIIEVANTARTAKTD